MFLLGVPLLIVPFLIYNIVAFAMPGVSWVEPLPPIEMVSGGKWEMSYGDLLVVLAIILLFIEIVKATRIGMRTIIVHMLAAVLFAACLVEFLLVKQAATSTFFILLVITFVEMLAGFTISIRTAQRNIELDSADKIGG